MEESKFNEEHSNDNLYSYSDVGSGTVEQDDTSQSNKIGEDQADPAGLEEYSLEEDEEEEDEQEEGPEKPSPFLLMFKVLANPINGWRAVRRSKINVEEAQQRCFYPLLAVLAICKFAMLFYNSRVDISDIVVSAVNEFVSFFFGYFCIIILLKILMPKPVLESICSEFGKVFVIINLSTLCLFSALLELLPMLWALLIFLPLWTVYIICRGARFFNFPENRQITYPGILCLLIVGIPALIDWALTEIMPK